MAEADDSDASWSDERVRQAAAAVWRGRARAEAEAAARFTRLSEQLAAAFAVAPVVQMARQAAEDERRHAALCRDLVSSLEGTAPEVAAVEARAVAPAGFSSRERVLYEVVALACVTETLSAALLGEMVERATDDQVREAMRAILRDEIDHSRLGWAHLAAERQRGAADVIGAHLPAMLRGTVEDELFFTAAEAPGRSALAGLGALDRPTRLRIFAGTMRQVVFPGLSRFEIDTRAGEAWLLARCGPAPT